MSFSDEEETDSGYNAERNGRNYSDEKKVNDVKESSTVQFKKIKNDNTKCSTYYE